MDNFGCLNSLLSLFYSYLVTNFRKKIMTFLRLQLNLTLPNYTNEYAFSRTTLPPSELHSLWMTPHQIFQSRGVARHVKCFLYSIITTTRPIATKLCKVVTCYEKLQPFNFKSHNLLNTWSREAT